MNKVVVRNSLYMYIAEAPQMRTSKTRIKVMMAEDSNIVFNGCIAQYDGYLVHELPAFFHHLPVDHCGLLRLRRLLVRLKRVLHQSDQTGAPPRIPGHVFSAR